MDAAADAAPLHHDLPRLARRSVTLYQDVLLAFQTAGEDCAAAALRLGELRTIYADVVAANLEVLRDGRASDLQAALRPYDAELDAAARGIMQSPTLSKCARDEAFTRSFDELVGTPP